MANAVRNLWCAV